MASKPIPTSLSGSHYASQLLFLYKLRVSVARRHRAKLQLIMGANFVLFFFLLMGWSLGIPMAASVSGLNQLSAISVEKPDDMLVSPSGVFTAGFFSVGENAFCFSIWFSEPENIQSRAIVWMANRDQPVNGKHSKLSILKTGNVILTDADKFVVWETNTASVSSVQLYLHDSGNLVLASEGENLWQSFASPTDTLLPLQPLTKNTQLVSSRSKSNYSSGLYKLFFDYDNTLRLIFDTPAYTSVYWYDPWLVSWDAARSINNNSRIAMLDSLGNFSSSDDFTFRTADYGAKNQRRLTMDLDGNLRVYSRGKAGQEWVVSWQAIQEPCQIHGICGANSICTYVPSHGRKCSCIVEHKMKDVTDWSLGCEPQFNRSCKNDDGFFVYMRVDFYGYDYGYFPNYTLQQCQDLCLRLCECIGFQFKYDSGVFKCYPKTIMLNGYQSPSFTGDFHLRVPKSKLFSYKLPVDEFQSQCPEIVELQRTYIKNQENEKVKTILWFATGLGGIELICVISVWCFLIRTQKNSNPETQGYVFTATGFKRFSYAELKKATGDFGEEIGRGTGGVVYKGTLLDLRVAAVKRLAEATRGEAEFLAEASTIGRLNHMHLIEMWGYCAEGKHRLLVYEYMEHGSLAKNLSSKTLDCRKRFQIAVGTARGLAYLHEECLEWVLHCDVKPENILLDSNYSPKVADFGLSKLLDRGQLPDSGFSRARGTRGYMAPEWVYNLPITSKVDVYSYGMVVLELVTGKNQAGGSVGEREHGRMVTWMRGKTNDGDDVASWMSEIVDPSLRGDYYDGGKMETLVKVALKCLREDRDERPSMGQVVDMLLSHENEIV